MNLEGPDVLVRDLPRVDLTSASPAGLYEPTSIADRDGISLISVSPEVWDASDATMASLFARVEPYMVRGLHERVIKPIFDRVVAAVLLVLTLPVVVFAALALRPQIGPGGPFLRQQRIGLDGRPFTLYKLRTMRPDRRRRQAPFDGPDRRRTHKTVDDPRHTPRGRLVRKLSIDELPQLWNVMKGDMSLVGPRPDLVHVVDEHGLRTHPRHRVKPGLTGPWQVSADRNRPLHEHLDRDLAYMMHITLWGDLALLVRTVGVVVGARGS